MDLKNKKNLAAKVLGIGKDRVHFNPESLKQIAEAITRQDILDLLESGVITIKEVRGRKKVVRRKHRRGMGKVKKRVNKSKKDYVILTRKLRSHINVMKRRGQIDKARYSKIRKEIKASKFKSKRHLVEGEIKQ